MIKKYTYLDVFPNRLSPDPDFSDHLLIMLSYHFIQHQMIWHCDMTAVERSTPDKLCLQRSIVSLTFEQHSTASIPKSVTTFPVLLFTMNREGTLFADKILSNAYFVRTEKFSERKASEISWGNTHRIRATRFA